MLIGTNVPTYLLIYIFIGNHSYHLAGVFAEIKYLSFYQTTVELLHLKIQIIAKTFRREECFMKRN